MLQIENYNSHSTIYQLSRKILGGVYLSERLNLANREILFIEDICKRVEKSKTVIYLLRYEDSIIGFVAVSATTIKDQPSMQIDYIFISKQFRSTELEFIDGCKPFRYLIELSINIAKELQSKIGLRYIVLAPDSDDIKHKYKQVGFGYLDKEWMFFKLD